jgi:hypothetical protein
MTADSEYTRAAEATASAVGELMVLYHRVTRTALVLNPTGGWMWQRLGEPCTAADLVRQMRARYPSLGPDDAERDVAAFLADLVKHSMVAVRE